MPAHTNLTFLSTRSSSQPFSGIPRVVSLFLGSHPDRKAGLGERPGEKSLIVYTRERGGAGDRGGSSRGRNPCHSRPDTRPASANMASKPFARSLGVITKRKRHRSPCLHSRRGRGDETAPGVGSSFAMSSVMVASGPAPPVARGGLSRSLLGNCARRTNGRMIRGALAERLRRRRR